MPIKPNIIAYAMILAVGAVIGSGLLYIFGSGGDNRAWVLWEYSVFVSPLNSSAIEEWKVVLAGANKRECEKRLARLADDLKQRAKLTSQGDMNIKPASVIFDGSVLHHGSSTTYNGQIMFMTTTKSLCFPDTVDPRSAVSK